MTYKSLIKITNLKPSSFSFLNEHPYIFVDLLHVEFLNKIW